MRLSPSRAAAAALIGSSLLVGCASKAPMPASPIATPLTDLQAISIAEEYLDGRGVDDRHVNYVEGTGDGNLVSFRSGFDAGTNPPVANHLVLVKHTGSVRELTFKKNQ